MESTSEGQCKIIGEISACKLWNCDYLGAGWALAKLSAGQFVMGIEDDVISRSLPDICVNPKSGENDLVNNNGGGSRKPRRFSGRNIGFFNNSTNHSFCSRSMYRGRSATLTCTRTSSLAAVMA